MSCISLSMLQAWVTSAWEISVNDQQFHEFSFCNIKTCSLFIIAKFRRSPDIFSSLIIAPLVWVALSTVGIQ